VKLLSFDIELYDDLEGDNPDFSKIRPSIAAYCLDDLAVKYFDSAPGPMSKEVAQKLVLEMMDNYKKGIIPLTHNGLSFDFKVLAYVSDMFEECAFLALNHFDSMFLITCTKGYFLGLDTLLKGMGVESKLHTVTLNDGSIVNNFSGKQAPKFWRDGEINTVRYYLGGDVIQPMKMAWEIEKQNKMFWFSKTGKPQTLYTKLIPVKECFKISKPDVSWMSNPPSRTDFITWMPPQVIEKELNCNYADMMAL